MRGNAHDGGTSPLTPPQDVEGALAANGRAPSSPLLHRTRYPDPDEAKAKLAPPNSGVADQSLDGIDAAAGIGLIAINP